MTRVHLLSIFKVLVFTELQGQEVIDHLPGDLSAEWHRPEIANFGRLRNPLAIAPVGDTQELRREPSAELVTRYRALAAELADIGFIARRCVVAATTTCSSKGCHCHVDPARRHGPHWQLGRSSGGKTRTRRLSEAQAQLCQGWIAERHRA